MKTSICRWFLQEDRLAVIAVLLQEKSQHKIVFPPSNSDIWCFENCIALQMFVLLPLLEPEIRQTSNSNSTMFKL